MRLRIVAAIALIRAVALPSVGWRHGQCKANCGDRRERGKPDLTEHREAPYLSRRTSERDVPATPLANTASQVSIRRLAESDPDNVAKLQPPTLLFRDFARTR